MSFVEELRQGLEKTRKNFTERNGRPGRDQC